MEARLHRLPGGLRQIRLSCPSDEWHFLFLATVKTFAINSGSLRMHPWEALLFKVFEIPGVARAIQVDVSLLGDRVLTVVEMKKLVSSHVKSVLGLGHTLDLEVTHLSDVAELLKQVQNGVL